MELSWFVWAIIGALGIGAFNTLLEGTKESVPQGLVYKHMFLSILLIFSGILSLFILIFYRVTHKKQFNILVLKTLKPPFLLYLVPSVIMLGYLIANLLALVKGGGVAMVIINLNMFVTIIAGALLFKDKITLKMAIGIIVSALGAAYVGYEKSKL